MSSPRLDDRRRLSPIARFASIEANSSSREGKGRPPQDDTMKSKDAPWSGKSGSCPKTKFATISPPLRRGDLNNNQLIATTSPLDHATFDHQNKKEDASPRKDLHDARGFRREQWDSRKTLVSQGTHFRTISRSRPKTPSPHRR